MKKLPVLFVLALLSFAVSAAPQVKLATNMGDIVIELDTEKAPLSSENFLQLAASGYYDGVIFHRVMDNFMIQGGGFNSDMQQRPRRPTIRNEAANGLRNVAGSLAMARTSDPHSASAQFFINLKDNAFLDYPGRDGWGYAVFGKVVKGFDVVQMIAKVATGANGMHRNVPIKPVIIRTATILNNKQDNPQ